MPRLARKPSAAAKNSKRRGTRGRFPRGARKDGRAETRTKHDYAVELIYIYESLSNRPKKMRRTETLMQQPMPQALRRYVT